MTVPGEVIRPPLYSVSAELGDVVQSRHCLFGDLGYVATVGNMVIMDDTPGADRHRATASFAAFDVEAPTDSSRLVVFECPGGPIMSAQAGITRTGPMTVEYENDGRLPENAHVVPNRHTPLPNAHLVYYDVPETGYGRALPGNNPEHYFGIESDGRAFAAFIEAYLSANKLEDNPVALAVSSFSAFRGTAAANVLADHGKPVNAIVRINPHDDYATQIRRIGAKEYQKGIGRADDPRLVAISFPVFAMTAKYHGRLPAREQAMSDTELFDEVHSFAVGEYKDALIQQRDLPVAKQEEIIDKLARYTGLSPEAIGEDLYVDIPTFTENLLADKGLVVSMLDGRIALPKPESVNIDPAVDKEERKIKQIVETYLSNLGFPENAIPEDGYRGIVKAYPRWDFGGADWRDRSTYRAMAHLIARQPKLSVIDLIGKFDLINPPGFTERYWGTLQRSNYAEATYRNPDDPLDVGPGVSVIQLSAGHNIGRVPGSREFLGKVIGKIAEQVNSNETADIVQPEPIDKKIVELASVLSRLGRDVDIGPLSSLADGLNAGTDYISFKDLIYKVVEVARRSYVYRDGGNVEFELEQTQQEIWQELLAEMYRLLGAERPELEIETLRQGTPDGLYPNAKTFSQSGMLIEETFYRDEYGKGRHMIGFAMPPIQPLYVW